ncbi:MAG: NUDIX hydrolase, partial [Clostridia bacterium]|nr:NUDIX hydrolase [Clostridia bacterium]
VIAGKLTELLKIYPTPGYTDEIIHIYLAENCTNSTKRPDDGEFVDCEYVDISQVLGMIESGEICDAKTVSAIYKYILSVK